MIRCPACNARLRWFLHAYTQWSVTTEAGSTVHGATDELRCKGCGRDWVRERSVEKLMTPAEWDAWLETQRIAIPRASVRLRKRAGLAARILGRRWSRK